MNKSGEIYAETTFTAKFKADESQTYKVNYNAEQGGAIAEDAATVNEGIQVLGTEGVTGSEAAPNPGYAFDGWYVGEDRVSTELVLDADTAKANVNKSGEIYAETTFTAKFSAITDNLVVNGYSDVYDGNPHGVTVKNTLDTDEVRYFVGEDEVENAFTDVTNGTEVTVEVYRDGVKIWSDTATVTITARPVTAYGSTSKVYDGSAALLEDVTLTLAGVAGDSKSGVVLGDDLSVASIAASDAAYAMADKHEDLSLVTENAGGLLALTGLSGGDAANYTLVSVTALGSITPQSITPGPDPDDNPDPSYKGVEISDPADQVYDGELQEPEITVKDSDGNLLTRSTDGGKTGDYVVTYGNNLNATDDGDLATVTITGINNYKGEVTKEFKIAPATLIVTTNGASKVYDGKPLTDDGYSIQTVGEDGNPFDGMYEDDGITIKVTGTQTNAGQSDNDFEITDWTNTESGNYTVEENLGKLTVFPQSIDPEDPDPDNPDPDDPNPDDPDPENPDQPFFTGATVNDPQNTVYNGTDQAWLPTVVSDEGVTLTQSTDGGETGDYIVSYGNSTINAGHIVVTIKGCGNYAGTVTREYTIFPATIRVHANNHSKVQGQADPSLTSWYEGAVANEIPGWTGFISRAAGEAPGQYAIGQNTLRLADGQNGFLESNYTLEFVGATFTITPAPVTPDGGDDTPVTPVTPVNPVPGPDDGADDATDDAETETITDDDTPLTESIEDDDTPLASGREDRDCWVHWFMFVGLAVSAIYYIGALVHRRKFTGDLKSYEDSVLNPDDQNRA